MKFFYHMKENFGLLKSRLKNHPLSQLFKIFFIKGENKVQIKGKEMDLCF